MLLWYERSTMKISIENWAVNTERTNTNLKESFKLVETKAVFWNWHLNIENILRYIVDKIFTYINRIYNWNLNLTGFATIRYYLMYPKNENFCGYWWECLWIGLRWNMGLSFIRPVLHEEVKHVLHISSPHVGQTSRSIVYQ